MAIKPRLPSMSANSQTCPELLVQPCSPHLFSHCSTEADKLLHHPDLGRTAGSMGCNRAGGGGYSWEPGQTHLPLDQSHFPLCPWTFLSLCYFLFPLSYLKKMDMWWESLTVWETTGNTLSTNTTHTHETIQDPRVHYSHVTSGTCC